MKENVPITTTSSHLAGELKKNSLVYTILYTLLLCLLAALLCFNYFSVFSSRFYLSNFNGKFLVGIADTSSYYQTEKGQVLIVESYKTSASIAIGDELFYSGNAGEGSGIVTYINLSQSYLTVENNGSKNVSISTIIGKVIDKKDSGGYILWTFQNWPGIIILNGILVVVVIVRTVLAYTVETSAKGRELKKKLKQQQKASKNLKKMQKNYKNTGLDAQSFDLLSGEFLENKQKIEDYAKRQDLPNAYAFLLKKVHRAYICKRKLSSEERSKITNCVELMGLLNNFDVDSEYMLADLILKTNMIWFDADNYIKLCSEYLLRKHKIDDLACFQYVLYVLIKKNRQLRTAAMLELVNQVDSLLKEYKDSEYSAKLLEISKFIKNLIKI